MAHFEHSDVTETMDDDELVRLSREGCEDALSLLVYRYASVVKYYAASLRSAQLETEDLAQEGMMGLLSAVRTYAPGSASFRTYASVCVRNRMLSVVKRSGAARQIPPSELVSMDDDQDNPIRLLDSEGDPAKLVVQKEEESQLENRLRELLSNKEYDALMLYLQAYAYDEIACKMQMSVKAVDNALQRARKKIVSVSLFGN